MQSLDRVLVFQTAFTGDVILTLPLVQVLHERFPDASIDIVVVPGAAPAVMNHPAIHSITRYDKKGKEKGLASAWSLARRLRSERYNAAIVPHRSVRSAAICFFAGIPRRIGFSTSAGRVLLTDIVPYDPSAHESVRNLNLLTPLGVEIPAGMLPRLYPSNDDSKAVSALISTRPVTLRGDMIAVAPGSVWATKRWLSDRYAELCRRLVDDGFTVALVGGKDDVPLGHEIESSVNRPGIINSMGKLSLLQSAELIGRCKVAVTNDSSPLHLAVAMRTPVVAIFGATVPEFGFAPMGEYDRVVQTFGLPCRPCAIHGGKVCPIETFDCMRNITVQLVIEAIHKVLAAKDGKTVALPDGMTAS